MGEAESPFTQRDPCALTYVAKENRRSIVLGFRVVAMPRVPNIINYGSATSVRPSYLPEADDGLIGQSYRTPNGQQQDSNGGQQGHTFKQDSNGALHMRSPFVLRQPIRVENGQENSWLKN
jgi:hypothetical protein